MSRDKVFLKKKNQRTLPRGTGAADAGRQKSLPWKIAAWALWTVMLIGNIRLIIVFAGEQSGDYLGYVNKAKEIAAAGAFYPRVQDLYGVPYLHAPGYVNFLALIFRVTENLRVIFVCNLLFLQGILFAAKQIVYRLTGSGRSADIFQALYCLYFTLGVGGGVVLANTEMLFCALVFASLALLTGKRQRTGGLILAGVLMGLANWIRPVAFVFLPAAIWGIYQFHKNHLIRRIAVYCGAMLAVIVSIGTGSYISSGKFVYQSTTMGVNLLVGNSPVADGNNHWDVFAEGNIGYVSSEDAQGWTYEDYEDFYFATALDWIKENPLGVIKLIPARMFCLYATDTYFATTYGNNIIETDTTEYLMGIIEKLTRFRIGKLSGLEWLVIFTEAYYLCILFLTVAGVVWQIRGRQWRDWLGIYSIVALGTGMHMILFGYGRFHFPYVIVFLMIAQGAFSRKCKV